MNPLLINVAIQELPKLIALIRDAVRRKNPNAPIPTDAEVFAAYALAFTSSLAKDDSWLRLHPR